MVKSQTKIVKVPETKKQVDTEVTLTCDICQHSVTLTEEDRIKAKDSRTLYKMCREKFGANINVLGGWLSEARLENGMSTSCDCTYFDMDICWGCLKKYGRETPQF